MPQKTYLCRIVLQIKFPHPELYRTGGPIWHGMLVEIDEIMQAGCNAEGYMCERVKVDIRTDDAAYVLEEVV